MKREAAVAETNQRTIAQQVLEQLRDMILSGELPPDTWIDQNDLAQRFGVSVVPVREALARLQSSGLVRNVPHRGVYIEALSLDELVDIYHVREVLEEHAARLAAPNLTDADVTEIARQYALMAAAAERDDDEAFLEANRLFHFTIYRAARGSYLLDILGQLWDSSERYRRLQLLSFPERARTSLFEATAILAACRRRDADSLGTMVRYKVHQTSAGLSETARRDKEPGN